MLVATMPTASSPDKFSYPRYPFCNLAVGLSLLKVTYPEKLRASGGVAMFEKWGREGRGKQEATKLVRPS